MYHTQTFAHTRRDGTNAASAFWNIIRTKMNADRAFIAIEPHYLDGIHIHSLIQARDGFRMYASKSYLEKAMGYNYIVPIDKAGSKAAVNLYCAKYVTKGNDYFYFGDKGAWIP